MLNESAKIYPLLSWKHQLIAIHIYLFFLMPYTAHIHCAVALGLLTASNFMKSPLSKIGLLSVFCGHHARRKKLFLVWNSRLRRLIHTLRCSFFTITFIELFLTETIFPGKNGSLLTKISLLVTWMPRIFQWLFLEIYFCPSRIFGLKACIHNHQPTAEKIFRVNGWPVLILGVWNCSWRCFLQHTPKT